MFSFLLVYTEVINSELYDNPIFIFLRNCQTVFQSSHTILQFYQYEDSNLSTFSPTLVIICLFSYNHSCVQMVSFLFLQPDFLEVTLVFTQLDDKAMIWAETLLKYVKSISLLASAVGSGWMWLGSSFKFQPVVQPALAFFFFLCLVLLEFPCTCMYFHSDPGMCREHIYLSYSSLISRISPLNFWCSIIHPNQNHLLQLQICTFSLFPTSPILLLSTCLAELFIFQPKSNPFPMAANWLAFMPSPNLVKLHSY